MTAYDKNGFRILFHFAKECPPGRPDVLVVVVSMLNTAPLPIKSIVLQAAVPKVSWLPRASRGRGCCLLNPTVLRDPEANGQQHMSIVILMGSCSRALVISLQSSFSLSSVNEGEVTATLWDRAVSI